MGKIKVFLDTDVIISSILSETGASYEIIRSSEFVKIISISVQKELVEVGLRKNVDSRKLGLRLSKVKTIAAHLSKSEVLKRYGRYVNDEKDSHVVAGAVKSKSDYLLTFNVKHYQIERIKTDLGVTVIKPGVFLQYLRNHENLN